MATWDEAPSENFLSAFDAPLTERQVFIRKTYGLFTVAVAAAGLGTWLISQSAQLTALGWQLSIVFLIAWYVLQFARPWAARAGAGAQYGLLGAMVVVVSFMTAPLVSWAVSSGNADIIVSSFGLASMTFGGLTLYVMVTKKDFSYIAGALSMAFFLILGLIIISLFIPFPGPLEMVISVGILLLACGILLYETSNILHHYPTTQAPLAAFGIFIAFVVIFWQIARIFLYSRD